MVGTEWTGKHPHQIKLCKVLSITYSLCLKDIWVFFEALQHTAYASQVSNHHILKREMRYQRTFRAFNWQKEELFLPCWSPGLLGFEVQLLDLNQHGAGQGLYRLLWPTSVWCALPLTCLSLTPITSLYALDTDKTQTSLCLWGNS